MWRKERKQGYLKTTKEQIMLKKDIVDELTSEQGVLKRPFIDIKIPEGVLFPEIKALTKKIKEFDIKKNNDTLICINDSLKYEKRISDNKTIIRYSNLFK